PDGVPVEDLLVDERVHERRPLLALRRPPVVLREGAPRDVEPGGGNHDPGPLRGGEPAPEQPTDEQRRPDQGVVQGRGAQELHCGGLSQIGDVQARSWISGCTNGNVVSLLQQDAPRWAFATWSGSLELAIAVRSFWHRLRFSGSTPMRSRHQW